MEKAIINLLDLEVRAEQAEMVIWQEQEALRLENGLALLPGRRLKNATIEVLIGSDGPAYPGVAFRVVDVLNFEMAYAVPHTSGKWDALQYDPVFHGSNTWQVYCGESYQRACQVPTGRWFRLRVDYYDEKAAIAVDGQPPLVVERLAQPVVPGWLGLWTFSPAYFCDLRVLAYDGTGLPHGETPCAVKGIIETWFIESFGAVTCEPNGTLNLNRYLSTLMGEVRLVRHFEMAAEGEVTFEFGFSDVLSLKLDGQTIFAGEHTFKGFVDRAARGYVELGKYSVRKTVSSGTHTLGAELKASEGFGWGLVLAACGEGLHWLPVELG